MRDIVLIHGGWHGGWVWKFVEPRLRQAGHRVFSPTLTGVGERSHLVHPDIHPDLHVQDVVNVIGWNELNQVVLVGHSYAGLVITGVAGQIPEKLDALVYLDAFVPTRSGESAFSDSDPQREHRVRSSVIEGYLVPPMGHETWSKDPQKLDWLKKLTTPHPIRCFTEGPTLTGKENQISNRHYIYCNQNDPSPFRRYYDLYVEDPGWKVHSLACLHDAMVDAPDQVTACILEACDTP